jgi:alpha-tubulin suppressor-like RCC1 family protein
LICIEKKVFCAGWGGHIEKNGMLSCEYHDKKRGLNTIELVEFATDHQIVNVSATKDHILMVTKEGRVLRFGLCVESDLENVETEMKQKEKSFVLLESICSYFVSLSCTNGIQSLFLTTDGILIQEGVSMNNDKEEEEDQYKELQYQRYELFSLQSNDQTVKEVPVSIVSGSYHWLVLTSSGKVFSWGRGAFGSLGHGNSESIRKPKMIKWLEKFNICSIAAGGKFR